MQNSPFWVQGCTHHAFTNFQKNGLSAMLHPKPRFMHSLCIQNGWIWLQCCTHEKFQEKISKKFECKSASKSPDYAPTMHPNTPFLSATMHPSHNFMIFRGFRGNFPLIRCTFSTLSNKVRIWQYRMKEFSWVINTKHLTDNKNFLKNCVDAMLHPNDDFKNICSFEGSDGSIWIDKGMCWLRQWSSLTMMN